MRFQRIDWDNPPEEYACNGCGVPAKTTSYPRVVGGNSMRRHPAQRSRRCRACIAAEQRERVNRDALTKRQLRNAERSERGEEGPITPRSGGSALAEGNIAADLYAQALRALAISPPVPVWEREEWA